MMSLPTLLAATLTATALFTGSAAEAWGGDKAPPGDSSGGDKKKGKEAPPAQKKEESASECVKHSIQARYVSGYDHLVHIKSQCSRAAFCKVSTDVNPKVQNVTIAPGAATTVLTFRGSPAGTFQAKVECQLEEAPP